MSDDPGPLLASGRSADLYDLGGGRVLRRSHDAGADTSAEARVMAFVAERGYPVPVVHESGGTDLVMDRVDGPTMADALGEAPWKVLWHARLLAKMQRRLARIEPPRWLLGDTLDTGRRESVVHLDLHPPNVILSQRHGPVVVGWSDAAGGPAGFDAALSFVRISTSEATTTAETVARRVLSESFRRIRGPGLMAPFLQIACEHRLGDPTITPDERMAVATLRAEIVSASSTR